jgi:hypothetical protein
MLENLSLLLRVCQVNHIIVAQRFLSFAQVALKIEPVNEMVDFSEIPRRNIYWQGQPLQISCIDPHAKSSPGLSSALPGRLSNLMKWRQRAELWDLRASHKCSYAIMLFPIDALNRTPLPHHTARKSQAKVETV